MDQEKVNQMLMMHSNKLPAESIAMIRDALLRSNVDDLTLVTMCNQLKDPNVSLVLSIVLGYFGVDRFYLGDVGMGIGKLITCGGCYIWWLIDIFLIMNRTRQRNMETLITQLNYQSTFGHN